MQTEPLGHCSGCDLVVPGGTAGCQAIFDGLTAKGFDQPGYFQVHRKQVDTYCLQHPDRYCASAKSLAAHLTGLCWLLEFGGDPAKGNETLRRWLNGPSPVRKPDIPFMRGKITVADVAKAQTPEAHVAAVDAWARSVWEAYFPLHALAREWVKLAIEGRKGT